MLCAAEWSPVGRHANAFYRNSGWTVHKHEFRTYHQTARFVQCGCDDGSTAWNSKTLESDDFYLKWAEYSVYVKSNWLELTTTARM